MTDQSKFVQIYYKQKQKITWMDKDKVFEIILDLVGGQKKISSCEPFS